MEFSIAVKDGQRADRREGDPELVHEQDVVMRWSVPKERLDEDYVYVNDDYHIEMLRHRVFDVYSRYKPNAATTSW